MTGFAVADNFNVREIFPFDCGHLPATHLSSSAGRCITPGANNSREYSDRENLIVPPAIAEPGGNHRKFQGAALIPAQAVYQAKGLRLIAFPV